MKLALVAAFSALDEIISPKSPFAWVNPAIVINQSELSFWQEPISISFISWSISSSVKKLGA